MNSKDQIQPCSPDQSIHSAIENLFQKHWELESVIVLQKDKYDGILQVNFKPKEGTHVENISFKLDGVSLKDLYLSDVELPLELRQWQKDEMVQSEANQKTTREETMFTEKQIEVLAEFFRYWELVNGRVFRNLSGKGVLQAWFKPRTNIREVKITDDPELPIQDEDICFLDTSPEIGLMLIGNDIFNLDMGDDDKVLTQGLFLTV